MDLEYNNYPDFTDKGDTNCVHYDADLFFPDPEMPNFNYLINEAKKICTGCPYIAECLTYAIDNKEPGIWGGTYEYERTQIRRARKAGLPDPVRRKPRLWS